MRVLQQIREEELQLFELSLYKYGSKLQGISLDSMQARTTPTLQSLAQVLKKGGLPNLKTFELKSCEIQDETLFCGSFFNILCLLPRPLSTLSISYLNGPSSIMNVITTAIDCGALPQLTSLDLHSNGMEDCTLQFLCDAITKGRLPGLKTLNLADNNLGEGGLRALARCLTKGKLLGLESLILGLYPHRPSSHIPSEVIAKLAKSLGSFLRPRLSVLDRGLFEVTDGFTAKAVVALATAYMEEKLPALKHFEILGNSNDKWDAKAMQVVCSKLAGKKLPKPIRLESMSLQCSITSKGLNDLVETANQGNLSNLKAVSLACIESDKVVHTVAGLISALPSLEFIR